MTNLSWTVLCAAPSHDCMTQVKYDADFAAGDAPSRRWLRTLFCQCQLLDPERLGDACAIGRIGPGAVFHMALLDVLAGVAHCARGVLEQRLLLCPGHQSEKVARLLPMVVMHAMVPVRPLATHRHRRLAEVRLVR